MVTPAEAARFRAANRELEDRIERNISQLWRGLGAATPQEMRDALVDYVPGLVDTYGRVAATIAAEYFEETTGVSATVADTFNRDAVQGSVRALAGGLWTGERATVLAGVSAAARRHMLQAGRSTLYESARRSPGVGYARMPEPGACNWCLLLSSRGAVYTEATVTTVSEARMFTGTSGREGRRPGEDFHDACRCDGVAVRDDDELPYDADALYRDRYMPARLADPESLVNRDDFSSDAAYEKRVADLTGMYDGAIAARMRVMFGGG